MANQTIVSFINNQRAREIPDTQIREELTTKGWDSGDVNQAFREANSSTSKVQLNTERTEEEPTTSDPQSLKDLFEDKSGRDLTEQEAVAQEEVSKQQEELVELFLGSSFTNKEDSSSDAYRMQPKEYIYIVPALPLFFFGGFIGALLAVGMIWRVTAVLKDQEADDQEKKGKIILFYITAYSAGLILFGIFVALTESLGITF